MKIQVLDSATVNKIAAGEVIERPASIVKELVENAIDAGASQITVEVRDGGISYIRVSDNGSGIGADDVRNAFLRHSTSKIRSAEDLDLITSLGFRGEALASIAAVSRVELVTKTPEALVGTRYIIEGGTERLMEEVAAVPGTTIKVEELFFNTPARRKFLKKPNAEAAAVTELMQRFTLGHPEISFQYIRGTSRVLHTPGDYQLRNSVFAVYGKEVLGELLPVDYEGAIRITGFISSPQMTRANRGYQHFFINGRMIKSRLIEKILEECYKDLIMPGNFPIAVLSLVIDPQIVDVNVHPTKTEVRFSDENLIREEVYKAVSRTLGSVDLVTRVVSAEMEPPVAPQPSLTGEPAAADLRTERELNWAEAFPEAASRAQIRTAPEASVQEKTPLKEVWQQAYYGSQEKIAPDPTPQGEQRTTLSEPQASYGGRKLPDPRTLRMIGQAFATYWMAEADGVLYLVDQHAAHERVLYDRVRKVLDKGKLDSQILLEPQAITLSPADYQSVMRYQELFEKMGFEVEPFGESTVLVRCVPYIFNGPLDPKDFQTMAGFLTEGSRNSAGDLLLDRMAMMSCKAAIKGNHPYSEQEARTLMEELFATTNPYNCPHGRPTMITMTQYQIEKLFKRIV
ncbi:MAG: DNA mismatch repair endonuclease MutL [Firmicutes bacterium]|nr:DNA mismatch repair endonuclease MutL [Bacillota bacterium]